jgi:hypothetical protein
MDVSIFFLLSQPLSNFPRQKKEKIQESTVELTLFFHKKKYTPRGNKHQNFTDEAWMTVVSLQAEKVENGELENPLPDAEHLFEKDDPRSRPLCLTEASLEDILESLASRLTTAARAQLPSNRTGGGPPRLILPDPNTLGPALSSSSAEPDPDIEVVYPPLASRKRQLTPDLCPHPPSPSSLDHLPSAKRSRLSADLELSQDSGWLSPVDRINLSKALSLLLDLLAIILDHPRKRENKKISYVLLYKKSPYFFFTFLKQ